MIRSFVALNIDSPIKNRIRLVQNDVKDELRDYRIKWENPDKFHLTLRFLGDVEENLLKVISEELDKVKVEFDNIKMTTSGIGFFPNQKYPNVVFIGLDDEAERSKLLAEEIENKLELFGFKPEKKFIPHITLGRFRHDNRKKIDKIINAAVEPIEITFDSFYLMKSELKPSGSIYEVLNEFKFKR